MRICVEKEKGELEVAPHEQNRRQRSDPWRIHAITMLPLNSLTDKCFRSKTQSKSSPTVPRNKDWAPLV